VNRDRVKVKKIAGLAVCENSRFFEALKRGTGGGESASIVVITSRDKEEEMGREPWEEGRWSEITTHRDAA
jgi:hypothetical protein